jgi:hypothetical protein
VLAGDVGTGGAPSVDFDPYGPLSPKQLSELARPLSVEEQKAADAYRAKSAPKSAPKSTAPSAQSAPVEGPGFFSSIVPVVNMPLWQVAIGTVGVVAIGVGVYKLFGKPSSTRSYMLRTR